MVQPCAQNREDKFANRPAVSAAWRLDGGPSTFTSSYLQGNGIISINSHGDSKMEGIPRLAV